MRNTAILFLAAVALTACRGSPVGGPTGHAPVPAGPPGGSPAAVLSGTLSIHDGFGNAGPFQIGSLTAIAIESALQGASPGLHTVRVDAFEPGGTLYVQMKASIDADARGAGGTSRTVEVVGTPIELFHMVGSWQFLLSVDDGPILASAVVTVAD